MLVKLNFGAALSFNQTILIDKPITSIRQTDIVVPLGLPPYNVAGNHATFGGFATTSQWPVLISALARLGKSNIAYSLIEAINGVAVGKTTFNQSNSALPNSGVGPFNINRFGDFLITSGSDFASPNFLYQTKSLIVPGSNLVRDSASFIGLNAFDPDWQHDFGASILLLGSGNNIMDVNYNTGLVNLYYLSVCGGPGLGSYTFVVTGINFDIAQFLNVHGAVVTRRHWDYYIAYNDSALPGGVHQYVPVGIIPDPIRLKNWILITNNNLGTWGFNRLFMNFQRDFSRIAAVSLDDAAIQAKFPFTQCSIQVTNFGFLINTTNAGGVPYFPGQKEGLLLLSPDMTKYALVKMYGINPTTAADIAIGGVAVGSNPHIDPTGTMYYWGQTNQRINNGFITNLSWNSVTLPGQIQPMFEIPGLCGCDPRSSMGIMEQPLNLPVKGNL